MFYCFSQCYAVEKGNQGVGQNHVGMTLYRVVQTLPILVWRNILKLVCAVLCTDIKIN